MILPTLVVEDQLRLRGFSLIAGVDEAGRGAWAGPLVAGAVVLDTSTILSGLRDSKLCSPKRREELFFAITAHAVAWAVGIVSVEELDAHGVGTANRLALQRAVAALTPQPEHVLVDGRDLTKFSVEHTAVIDGDATVRCIAAASIVAKVVRDRMMAELHVHYPHYGFHRHRGYGTKEHHRQLLRHGVTSIHRHSFAPIKAMVRTHA